MSDIHRVGRLWLAALIVLTLPVPIAAEEPVPIAAKEPPPDPRAQSPLDLSTASQHSGQVSFGFGTNGAFSQISGTYSLSPRLYARYGLGTGQALWHTSRFTPGSTGNGRFEATHFFFSLGSPAVFRFGSGIDLGAEVFVASAPVQGFLLAPGPSRSLLDPLNYDSAPFMSPWHQRAWSRDPLTRGKSWLIQFDYTETTPTGTQGGRITIGK